MKRKIFSMLALVLAFSLLCGCSDNAGFTLKDLTSYLTGQDQSDTQEPQQTDSQEPDPPMAADAVLNAAEALDVLHLAYQESYGLNPFTTVSLCNRAITSLLFEPLYLVTADFEAEPVLAESLTVSDDGRTTTVTLRSGVQFHGGKTLTAQDVVYSYETAKASDYYGNRFIHVDTVTAQDDRTVVFATDTAYESLALLLDFPIVRDGTGEQAVPDGTGPFVYSSTLKLNHFDNWHGTDWPIPCSYAELTPCDTAADIRDQFEYSQVDLVWTDPNSSAHATFHNDSEIWYSPTTVMQYIGFNTNTKAFSNPAVRACITYAIDRETIVAEDMKGYAEAASLPASPRAACYDSGLAAKYDYDLDDFQAALDAAQIQDYTADGILDVYYKGYAVPLEGTMIVSAGNTQRRLTATRIADDLNALGFHITVQVLEEDKFQTALRYGNYDLYYTEMRMSANFDLGSFFRNGGSAAYGGLENGAVVNLCAAMLENSGNAYDLHKRVMDQGYLCPVVFKTYAVYTTRGAAQDLEPALDWVVHGAGGSQS